MKERANTREFLPFSLTGFEPATTGSPVLHSTPDPRALFPRRNQSVISALLPRRNQSEISALLPCRNQSKMIMMTRKFSTVWFLQKCEQSEKTSKRRENGFFKHCNFVRLHKHWRLKYASKFNVRVRKCLDVYLKEKKT